MYTYDPRSGEWKVQRQKGPGAFWPSSVASWWAPGSVRVPISHKVERSRGSLLIDILFLHTNMQTWAHTHTPLYAHSKKQKFFKSFLWIYCVSQQHTKSRHCVLYILTEHCSSHTKPSHFLRLLSWMLCASVKMGSNNLEELIWYQALLDMHKHILPLYSWCLCWCLRVTKWVNALKADPGNGSNDALWGSILPDMVGPVLNYCQYWEKEKIPNSYPTEGSIGRIIFTISSFLVWKYRSSCIFWMYSWSFLASSSNTWGSSLWHLGNENEIYYLLFLFNIKTSCVCLCSA